MIIIILLELYYSFEINRVKKKKKKSNEYTYRSFMKWIRKIIDDDYV
jgi:hypothetical protein